MTEIDIPQSPEDVDPLWLTRALSQTHPGVIVETATVDQVVHGAGTKLRLHLTYRGACAGLPAVLWAKAGWEDHSALMERVGSYAREARFYRDIAPQLTVRAPRCWFAAWNEQGQGIILMEDLTANGGVLWDCRTPASPDSVADMLDNLARVHAPYWESAALRSILDVPIRRTGPSSEWPLANGPPRIAACLAGPRGTHIPARVKDPDRIDRAFWAMVDSMAALPHGCLIHGDAHPGNSYTNADDRAALYDWQTLARGPWGHDVAYHIVTALNVENRRRCEQDLLRHYLERLRAHGVAAVPAFGDAWDHYRRHIAYPLHIWITNLTTHQSEQNCQAMATRLGIAADDFDFFTLWGV